MSLSNLSLNRNVYAFQSAHLTYEECGILLKKRYLQKQKNSPFSICERSRDLAADNFIRGLRCR